MGADDRNAWKNRRGVTREGMPEAERTELESREVQELLQIGVHSQQVIKASNRSYSHPWDYTAQDDAAFQAAFEGD